MSYPPPVYDGAEGEISATFRPAGTDPDIVYATGGTAHYLATGATTNGHFGLYRWNMSARPSGPEPHFHRTLTESFFVPKEPSGSSTAASGSTPGPAISCTCPRVGCTDSATSPASRRRC
jgi:hypothetical protein